MKKRFLFLLCALLALPVFASAEDVLTLSGAALNAAQTIAADDSLIITETITDGEGTSVTVLSHRLNDLRQEVSTLLDEDGTMLMKMAKEEKRMPKAAKEKTKTKTSAAAKDLSNEEAAVFEKLRALRMELAKEHKVPPYIIFSDKRLIQMAMEKPSNKEEMLAVSGVGESKFEKYGEPFLACLAER